MKLNLNFDIVLGKWVLFSILIFVIVYGSYYSLFGLREGFAPKGKGKNVLDCSQSKCYEQPKTGPNDPEYDEDVGFCGVEYTDKSGEKFMFGCDSSDTCNKLDCNTACKRDPKTKKFMGDCNPYPNSDSNDQDQDQAKNKDGNNDRANNDNKNNNNDNNSGYNYYDSDMDDYMSKLMKPGQMIQNKMYNFRQAHYGCDASKYGCCADGFTYKKDASGKNCFKVLPYYNPILFRGGA